MLSDHLGDAASLGLTKDLLGGAHSALTPAVSVATTLGMLGGGCPSVFGGTSGVLGPGAVGMLGGMTAGNVDLLAGSPISHGSTANSSSSMTVPPHTGSGVGALGGGGGGILGAGQSLLGGGPGVYITPPMLPAASLLYSSLCSALPHTPTTATPPSNTPTREDVIRPSSSNTNQGPSHPLAPLPLPVGPVPSIPENIRKAPDPVWRPY